MAALTEENYSIEVVAYEEISIKEMEEENSIFYYPCPCGDLFELRIEDLITGLRFATCPSCSLQIRVIITNEELNEICSSRKNPSRS